jgi:hypothetical protein
VLVRFQTNLHLQQELVYYRTNLLLQPELVRFQTSLHLQQELVCYRTNLLLQPELVRFQTSLHRLQELAYYRTNLRQLGQGYFQRLDWEAHLSSSRRGCPQK